MVRHALRAAVAQDYPDLVSWAEPDAHSEEGQGSFPCAPAHLRPPLRFIATQVRPCAEDFAKRGKYEDEGEAGEVVKEIKALLDPVEARFTPVT